MTSPHKPHGDTEFVAIYVIHLYDLPWAVRGSFIVGIHHYTDIYKSIKYRASVYFVTITATLTCLDALSDLQKPLSSINEDLKRERLNSETTIL